MNIQLLSKQLLEEALTKGTITLLDGTVRELKATEILSVAKFIVTNNLTTESATEPELNMPSEMGISPTATKNSNWLNDEFSNSAY